MTGSAAGIGRAAATAFARRGAAVVVADLDEAGGEEVARALRAEGHRAVFVATDVSRRDDVERMVATSASAFASSTGPSTTQASRGATADVTALEDEAWDRVIAVNLTSVWLWMRHEIPAMLEGGGGAIVNGASIAGLVGFPRPPGQQARGGGPHAHRRPGVRTTRRARRSIRGSSARR